MIIERFLTGPLQVNTYLVIDSDMKKGFIVDPGGFSNRIIEEINSKEIEIEYIILTHGHGDHIGGVLDFKKIYKDANIVSNKYEDNMLKTPELNFSRETIGSPISITPDILVNDGDHLCFTE